MVTSLAIGNVGKQIEAATGGHAVDGQATGQNLKPYLAPNFHVAVHSCASLPGNCTVVFCHFGWPRHGPRAVVFDRRQQRCWALVLERCPGVFWRLVIALGCYAGLRIPSEVAGLTWDDIAWDTGRLTVRSPKTARHEGHAVRLVPICPEPRSILADAYELLAEGDKLILPRTLTGASNLRTTVTKIITRSGHKPWPRLFQKLRASGSTEWIEKYPNHVLAKWLGHSPMIAATHYLQARERHFKDVVTGGGQGASENPAVAVQASVHIRVQSKAAAASRSKPT